MVSKKIIVLFVLALVLITGCSNKITEKEYRLLRHDIELSCGELCNQKLMKMYSVDVLTFNHGDMSLFMKIQC